MAVVLLAGGEPSQVDASDLEYLSQFSWRLNDDGYAMRHARRSDGTRTTVKMHREILGLSSEDAVQVDHINGNRLDNRKSNLRKSTSQENSRNRARHSNSQAPFKGICWHKHKQKWLAHITVSGTKLHLGYFTDEYDAALAYDEAAIRHFGDRARLNFPERTATYG